MASARPISLNTIDEKSKWGDKKDKPLWRDPWKKKTDTSIYRLAEDTSNFLGQKLIMISTIHAVEKIPDARTLFVQVFIREMEKIPNRWIINIKLSTSAKEDDHAVSRGSVTVKTGARDSPVSVTLSVPSTLIPDQVQTIIPITFHGKDKSLEFEVQLSEKDTAVQVSVAQLNSPFPSLSLILKKDQDLVKSAPPLIRVNGNEKPILRSARSVDQFGLSAEIALRSTDFGICGLGEYVITWRQGYEPDGRLFIEINAELVSSDQKEVKKTLSKRVVLQSRNRSMILEPFECKMELTDNTRKYWCLMSNMTKSLKIPDSPTSSSSVRFYIDYNDSDTVSERSDIVCNCSVTHPDSYRDEQILLTIHIDRKMVCANSERQGLFKFVPEDGKRQITKYVRNELSNGKDVLEGKQMRASNFAIAVVGPEGRTLSFLDDSVTLEIPKDALTKPTVIYCFRKIEDRTGDIRPTNIVPYARPVNCSADGTRFTKPVTLKFRHFICMDDIENVGLLKALTCREHGTEWFADENDEVKIDGEWAILTTYHFCSKTVGALAASVDGQKLPRRQAQISTVLFTEKKVDAIPEEMELQAVVMAGKEQMLWHVSRQMNRLCSPQSALWTRICEPFTTKYIDLRVNASAQTLPKCYQGPTDAQEISQSDLQSISEVVLVVPFPLECILDEEYCGDTNEICRMTMDQPNGGSQQSILQQAKHAVNWEDHQRVLPWETITTTTADHNGPAEWIEAYGMEFSNS